jgi:hypothetical protein
VGLDKFFIEVEQLKGKVVEVDEWKRETKEQMNKEQEG